MMEEYKSGIYYNEQERDAWKLVELYVKIVIPFCGIIAGLIIIIQQFRNLINAV